jgi:hypothetical protein
MEEPLNTLVYKRTHTGDPDESGIFGIHDCMGRVRQWPFDAVIGVGGKSPWSGDEGLARKINWIGIKPSKSDASSAVWSGAKRPDWSKTYRGPLVTFDCFVFLGEKGPALKTFAPNLFRYMFEDQHVRLVMSRSLPREMQDEVQDILSWAKTLQPRKRLRVPEKASPTKRKC